MRIFIFILLAMLVFLLLLAYSLLAIAGEEDERAERMYRKWKEHMHEREEG